MSRNVNRAPHILMVMIINNFLYLNNGKDLLFSVQLFEPHKLLSGGNKQLSVTFQSAFRVERQPRIKQSDIWSLLPYKILYMLLFPCSSGSHIRFGTTVYY